MEKTAFRYELALSYAHKDEPVAAMISEESISFPSKNLKIFFRTHSLKTPFILMNLPRQRILKKGSAIFSMYLITPRSFILPTTRTENLLR